MVCTTDLHQILPNSLDSSAFWRVTIHQYSTSTVGSCCSFTSLSFFFKWSLVGLCYDICDHDYHMITTWPHSASCFISTFTGFVTIWKKVTKLQSILSRCNIISNLYELQLFFMVVFQNSGPDGLMLLLFARSPGYCSHVVVLMYTSWTLSMQEKMNLPQANLNSGTKPEGKRYLCNRCSTWW